MKKIIVVISCLFLASLLQGCIAAAAVVGVAAGGAIAADNRSFQNMSEDHKIVYNIEQKIHADDNLMKNSHIVVASYNRVVLLAGQVASDDLRSQAEQMTKDVPNIRRVFNEITVEPSTSMSRRSKDAAITANVKARLMATTNVSSRQVKVITENGTVYLMGTMTREQAGSAAKVAGTSTGVQKVVKLIEYVNV